MPAAVVVLGLVSFFTDVSSEMIVPFLPLLLTRELGAGPAFVGLVEGAADALAALGKLGSGLLADRAPRQKPLVAAGYALSTAMRPLFGLAAAPVQVLGIRLADRVGKGLRTSPRDVWVASATAPERRAAAFGFQRGLDHLGAAVGPSLALALVAAGVPLREVFFWSVVPGAIAVGLVLVTPEQRATAPVLAARPLAGGPAARPLRALLVVIGLAALGAGTDAFLVVRLVGVGGGDALVPVLWLALHAVRAGLSTGGGFLADRFGHRRVAVAALVAGAAAYAGLALAATPGQVIALAAVWGLRAALGEGAERALVVEVAGEAGRGRALGLYYLVAGLAALPAGLAFGFVYGTSPAAAFGAGAALLFVAAVALARLRLGAR